MPPARQTRLLRGASSILLAALAAFPYAAHAQFEDTASPALKLEPARRFYARFGYTYISPNDKSQPTRDISGPVIRADEVLRTDGTWTSNAELIHYKNPLARCWLGITTTGYTCPVGVTNPQIRYATNSQVANADFTLRSLLRDGIQADNPSSPGLGVPAGVTNDAAGSGAPTVSVGMFLDEDKKWAAETFVLALPFKNAVNGSGRIGSGASCQSDDGKTDGGSCNLGKVVETNILPATLLLHRYFGDKNAKFRASVGVGVSYAIFFDSQATSSLEQWAGGPTKVKIKNAFGGGLFVGGQYALNDRWHLSAMVGYEKLKTTATLTTTTTPDMLADSWVSYQSAADIGTATVGAISLGDSSLTRAGYSYNGNSTQVTATKAMLRNLARARNIEYGTPEGTLGDYTREIKTELDPWVFNISIGYSF